jgi:uncharacterized protein
MALNVFWETMISCSTAPLTGYFRDGFCHCQDDETVVHVVCCEMTEDFLTYSASVGNDLSTPRVAYMFEGLKPGDRWCLNAHRFVEAYRAGKSPKVILEATDEKILEFIPLSELVKLAHKN